MREYEDRFLSHGVVSLDDIAALSVEDFRESLGVRRLGHRRAMWDAAGLLRDAYNPQTRRDEGENVSTLNHQMNIRTFLAWMRLTVQVNRGHEEASTRSLEALANVIPSMRRLLH
mmetsp:Transcript_25278/g.36387  ORF Transcript_25278/g.36387 Transcript_25278/m.36387 type:complete len:115 (+) Transcript_25278:217-561(+)